MGRLPTINNNNIDSELKKGPWTPEEDQKLVDYVRKHGHGSWQLLPKKARLNRSGKSCRLRWINYLKPDIKRGNFSPEEEQTIINLHSVLGNKWATIATHLPGRTDNEIKNFWNTRLRKKLVRSGIDPTTHQPITNDQNNLNLLLNLSTLFPNSNFNNPTMKNPFEDLAKIRLLCNMLQIMNPNPVPNFLGLGSSHNFNQLEGLYNGISSLPSQFSNMEQFPTNNSQFQYNLDSFSIPDEYENKNKGTIVSTSNNLLPALIQTAPEISSDVKFTDEIPKYDELLGICSDSVNSNWGTVMEDEASCSFWKDIFTESSFL